MLSLHVCLGSFLKNSPLSFERFLCATEVFRDLLSEPQILWSHSEMLFISKLCSFFNKSLLESLSDVSAYNFQ